MEENESSMPTNGVRRVETDLGNKAQRLLRVDQIFSRKDRQTHFVRTAKDKQKPDQKGKTAMVVRRVISVKGLVSRTEIDIRSTALGEIMKEIFQGVEGLSLNKTPPEATPEQFFFARKQLFDYKENEKRKDDPSQAIVNDIGTALQFIEEDFGTRINDLKSLQENGQITFDLLWALFGPGEILFSPCYGDLGEEQATRLVSATYKTRMDGTPYLLVTSELYSHDGESFGRGSVHMEVDGFDGARKITSLPVFPISCLSHPEEICEKLISRGKKLVSLIQKPVCMEYGSRLAIQNKYMPDGQVHTTRVAVSGRVMVDPTALLYYGDMDTLNKPWIFADRKVSESLTDAEHLLCASWVNGFCFATKVWARFMVSQLEPVQWNMKAFSKLAIDEKRRDIIRSLVSAHSKDSSMFEDFVQNKGKGLVGLLSGNPGVGKTLTAEVVAEATSRPLYQATGGELGIKPDEVDKRLEQILDIARRWSSVLLIDEADVFLCKRGKTVEQDTLVSIFLRRIEYFQGVLILTTNRREQIDPAFQSRVHFRLHYPDLDQATRRIIWTSFVEQHTKYLDLSEQDIHVLAQHALNGRQIKHFTSSAVSIAHYKNKVFSLSDFTDLLETIFDWDEL